MKVSISASLLLLIALLHCARADDVDWKECIDKAFCLELKSCNGNTETKLKDLSSGSRPQCVGVYIKAETTKMWTISIINDKQKPAGTFNWMIGSNLLFTCTDNVAAVNPELSLTVESISKKSPSSSVNCVFTVKSTNDKISTILKALGPPSTTATQLTFSNPYKMTVSLYAYEQIEEKIKCNGEQLFTKEACDEDTEDCVKVLNEQTWGCLEQPRYLQLFRNDRDSDFYNATIACDGGTFTYTVTEKSEAGKDNPVTRTVESGAQAKCARKKCSQCVAKSNFTALFQQNDFYECKALKCKEGFMLINSTKGEVIALEPEEPVLCSDQTKVKPEKVTKESDARWVVEDDKDFEIETAVCVQSIACDTINRMATNCGKSKNCVNAVFDAQTRMYHCENGTEHIYVGKHLEMDTRIKPVECNETGGKWILTDATTNASISVPTGEKITIKCIYEPVAPAPKSGVAKSAFPWWIIVLVVVFILLLVGIGIATYFYRKGRTTKKAPIPVTKTSSSSSNASGKPPSTSSAEKEPLTSAISVTGGDSLHTALPTKPTVVLAKADLRASTAAVSSDTSTKKEEKEEKESRKESKKEKEESIPDADENKKGQERTCHDDDSNKKKSSDVTSTKEKLVPVPDSDDALKSQTGGDGESQVSTKNKNGESAKLLPNKTPRKYSKTSTKGSEKRKPSNTFLALTDSDEDEPSKTGSKRKLKKRK